MGRIISWRKLCPGASYVKPNLLSPKVHDQLISVLLPIASLVMHNALAEGYYD